MKNHPRNNPKRPQAGRSGNETSGNRARTGGAQRFGSKTLRTLFAIDPRSLACFRIAIAGMILADLAIRATDLRAMYSDEGMFPRSEICHHYTSIWNWSFHFGSGLVGYQALLFAIAAALGLTLLLGFQTRLSAIGSWLFLLSLDHRVPPILSGADVLLCALLFWGMFLPLGRVWSLDKWLERRRAGPQEGNPPQQVFSVASAAILLQMALMYFCSAIFKSNGSWLRGEAVAGALAHDFYGTPIGSYLLHFPLALSWITWSTFALEWAGPVLLFIPKRTASIRLIVIGALAAMHLGIAVCLEVDFFSPVALTGLMLFVPSEFWNSRFVQRIARGSASWVAGPAEWGPKGRPRIFYGTEALCLLLLLYVLTANLAGLSSVAPDEHSAGDFLRIGLGLGQKWGMFDEVPTRNGWYVAWAKLKDGSDVDLLRKGAKLSWDKPSFPAAEYRNHRWRKCFREMSYFDQLGFQVFRLPVSQFLCRDWNRRNTDPKQITEFDLVFCDEGATKSTGSSAVQMTVRERLVHLELNGWDEDRTYVAGFNDAAHSALGSAAR